MNQFIEFIGNHPMLFAALVAVIVWMVSSEVRKAMIGIKAISAKEAVQLINHAGAIMLDIRPSVDFQKGHIINAKNAPLSDMPASYDALSLGDVPIILYCAMGNKSAHAGGALKKQGVTKLFYLKRGLNGWMGENLPIEK